MIFTKYKVYLEVIIMVLILELEVYLEVIIVVLILEK